jgi:ceramide glucosyltransferase
MHTMTMVFGALVASSLVYCLLTVIAVRVYLAVRPPALLFAPAISVLRPLHGVDDGLEENLRSCFAQDYPEFELLFAVHTAEDAAVPVFERVRAEFPAGPPARLVITGDPPSPNAKAFSLQRLTDEARFDLLVMSDSDVRARPDMLRVLAAEFQDPSVGLITCPYRAVSGRSLWSRLEAVGMNTEFVGGVLVARMLEGMKFALGPTIAARREVIERAGGFRQLGEFLAEDFVLGQRAAQRGFRVLLSSHVIEHRIGSQALGPNLSHRLRWARSTRRSRPLGYWGQVLTNPLPLALLLCMIQPHAWPVLLVTVAFRAGAAWATANWALGMTFSASDWLLLPLQDLLSTGIWAAGFFGNSIQWRGRRCSLLPDGRFKLVS